MATVGTTHFESKGGAVDVTLSHAVSGGQIAYAQGWLGVTGASADSGDTIALDITRSEYQFVFPADFSAVKGDTVYVDITDVTGHSPDSTAFYTATGSNRVALCKLTSDLTAISGGKMGTGILLSGLL